MSKQKLEVKKMVDLVQEQYQTKELILDLGEEQFTVQYDVKFKDSKIQDYIKEWMLIKTTYVSDVEINMFDMSFILILKHFTDLPFEHFNKVEEKVDHYVRMTNLLFDLKDKDGMSVFNKVFLALDEEEIKKISQKMTEVGNEILAKTEEMKAMAKELEEVK